MKYLVLVLSLLSFSLFGQVQDSSALTGKTQHSQSGGTPTYWVVTGNFSDESGLYDSQGILPGDVFFFSDSGVGYFLPITLVESATPPSFTIRVSRVGITNIVSVPTGAGVIFRPTLNEFNTFASGISNPDQQTYQSYFAKKVEQALSGAGGDGNGIYSGGGIIVQDTSQAQLTTAQSFGIGHFADVRYPNYVTDYGLSVSIDENGSLALFNKTAGVEVYNNAVYSGYFPPGFSRNGFYAFGQGKVSKYDVTKRIGADVLAGFGKEYGGSSGISVLQGYVEGLDVVYWNKVGSYVGNKSHIDTVNNDAINIRYSSVTTDTIDYDLMGKYQANTSLQLAALNGAGSLPSSQNNFSIAPPTAISKRFEIGRKLAATQYPLFTVDYQKYLANAVSVYGKYELPNQNMVNGLNQVRILKWIGNGTAPVAGVGSITEGYEVTVAGANTDSRLFILADGPGVTASYSANQLTITIPTGTKVHSADWHLVAGDVQASADGGGVTNWTKVRFVNTLGNTSVTDMRVPLIQKTAIPASGLLSDSNAATIDTDNNPAVSVTDVGSNAITIRVGGLAVGSQGYNLKLTGI